MVPPNTSTHVLLSPCSGFCAQGHLLSTNTYLNHPSLASCFLAPSLPDTTCYAQLLSCVQLYANPWSEACQDPLSMEFSRQEYWHEQSFPSPGDLPNPGIELRSPTWQADSLHLSQILILYYMLIYLHYVSHVEFKSNGRSLLYFYQHLAQSLAYSRPSGSIYCMI